MSAENTLTTRFQAVDEMSPVAKDVKKNVEDIGKATHQWGESAPGIFDKISAATLGLVTPTKLALAGITALGGAVALSVRAAIQDEQAQARLGAALSANIPGWAGNTKAIDEALKARQRYGFGAEAMQESVAQLVAETKDANQALYLQGIAMDLARAKGLSLAQAGQILIQVQNGQLGAVRRYGISLGNAKDSATALSRIQEQVAGSADRMAGTIAVKGQVIADKASDIEAAWGRLAIPVLSAVADEAMMALDGLDALSQGVTSNTAYVESMTKAFGHLIAGDIPGWARNVVTAMGAIRSQLDPVAHIADRGEESFYRLADGAHEVTKEFRQLYHPARDIARALDKVAENAEDAAGELGELIYGPQILKGELAELQLSASQTEKEIRKLARKKDLTKEDRLELAILRGDLAETRADLLTTATKLKLLGEPLPKGLERSINRVIDRQSLANTKIQTSIAKWRFWLGLTGGSEGSGPRNQAGGDEPRAAGGPVAPGRSYTVGENGQERLVMFPGGGGMVIPDGSTRGGGGDMVTVPIVLQLDGREVWRSSDRHQLQRLKTTPVPA